MEGIVVLLLGAFVVAATILTLFHLKDRFGMGPLFVLVGSQQHLQALLAENMQLTLPFGLRASPGSAVHNSLVILLV